MCSSAPSVWSVTRPESDTHLYWFAGSTTRTAARGSSRRWRSLARPIAVLNHTSPSTSSIQTTVECGDPSFRNVVTFAVNAFSRRNARCSSFRFATPSPFVVASPHAHHPRRNEKGPLHHPRRRHRRAAPQRLADLPCHLRSPRRRALHRLEQLRLRRHGTVHRSADGGGDLCRGRVPLRGRGPIAGLLFEP